VVRVQREALLAELSVLTAMKRKHRDEPLVALMIEAASLHTSANLKVANLADARAEEISAAGRTGPRGIRYRFGGSQGELNEPPTHHVPPRLAWGRGPRLNPGVHVRRIEQRSRQGLRSAGERLDAVREGDALDPVRGPRRAVLLANLRVHGTTRHHLTSRYRSAFAATTPPPVRQIATRPRWPVGNLFVADRLGAERHASGGTLQEHRERLNRREGPSSDGPSRLWAPLSALPYPTRMIPLICGPWTRQTKR